MRKCCVQSCGSVSSLYGINDKTALFKFPSDPKLKEAWSNALMHLNEQFDINSDENSYVCEKHFRSEDIRYNNCRTTLTKLAVPTIFPKNWDGECTEFLLSTDENMVDLTCFMDKSTQTYSSSELSSKTVQPNSDNETKAVKQFFCCENCGHINSKNLLSSSSLIDYDDVSEGNVTTEHHTRKRKTSNSVVDIDFTPKLFKKNASLSDNEQDFSTPKYRKKRLHFPGDVRDDTDLTPRSSKKFISSLKKTVIKQRKKIRAKGQTIRRQRQRIITLRSLLDDLRNKKMLSENASELLELGDDSIITQIRKGKVNNTYTPEVRSFALTLHFYSPRAYRYIRDKFKDKLLAPRTLRKWCESVDGEPGITKEALNVLTVKIKEFQEKGIQLRFCMAIDEMSIRKQIEFDFAKKKFSGYVDFGGIIIDRDISVAATKAWVIMLTAVNANFKIPVAYYLTNSLNGKEQASIVNQILRVLHENNAVVVALVFDGASTNVSMVNQLNRKILKPTYFLHPITKERIHIIWDVCHMLKLIRNTLASKQVLHDAQGQRIEWRYIAMLHEIQEKHRIRLGNRLTKQHIKFNGRKMNVKLAAQTLSRSVADALSVLKEKDRAFKNCGATIKFIRTFDKLFDICNSKSKFGKYDKRPINRSSAKETFDYFTDAAKYILGLKLNKKKIIKTKSYTGFFGFLQSMSSIHNLYLDLVKNGPMDYLLTFKLSQDHLETFFGSIRSRHGFNNNPNAIQFRSAYKQLIIHNEVTSPATANCIKLDDTNILTVSSTSKIIRPAGNEDELYDPSILSANFKNAISSHGLHDVVSDAVVYIAGFIERSIRRKLICQPCLEALDANPMMGGILIDKKNFGKHGGLCTPRQAVVVLCRLGEKNIKSVDEKKQWSQNRMYFEILNKCLRDVPQKLLENMEDHVKDCGPMENHRYLLIRSIFEEYLKVKLCHIGKLQTMELHSQFIRSKNTKLIQFAGQ